MSQPDSKQPDVTPEHEHVWQFIEEVPVTTVREGYTRMWGNHSQVTYQTGVRRRSMCSVCREVAEDEETFELEKRLTR